MKSEALGRLKKVDLGARRVISLPGLPKKTECRFLGSASISNWKHKGKDVGKRSWKPFTRCSLRWQRNLE